MQFAPKSSNNVSIEAKPATPSTAVNSKVVNLSGDCMFSGELADDNEHVISQWLSGDSTFGGKK